jgi:hypothetical protein
MRAPFATLTASGSRSRKLVVRQSLNALKWCGERETQMRDGLTGYKAWMALAVSKTGDPNLVIW